MIFPSILNFFKIIIFLILSWILVHFFAAFGFFVAFAYPIWAFFVPGKLSCIYCQFVKEGQTCLSCGRIKNSAQISYPKSFRSIIINVLLILIFSFFCLGLVILEGRILFSLGFPPTPRTVSFIIPSKGQYRLEEVFPMKIEIVGIKTPVNAIQTDIGFDPQRLEVIDIITEDSFANIFIQKEINNNAGYARLTGGLPNPGFFASHGIFGTILFKGFEPGLTQVEFLPSSLVLANDGRGTNVLKDLVKASYLILPEKISQSEESLQESLIQPIVLGETTEETQMKFYEENHVLGAKSIGGEIEKNPYIYEEIIDLFSKLLEKIDRFILDFWSKCLIDCLNFFKLR